MRLVLLLVSIYFCLTATLLADQNKINITIFNLSFGQSILIQTKKDSALIDSATLYSGKLLLRKLKKQNIKKLTYLIHTHPHLDHISGFFIIKNKIKIDKLRDNGQKFNFTPYHPLYDIYLWYTKIFREKNNYAPLYAGDNIILSPDVRLTIIWPPQNSIIKDWNEASLVIKVRCNNFQTLLMGDANSHSENKLLNSDIKASLLVAGHHGAKDTASINFINKVSPQATIISAEKNNPRKYPDKYTVKKYQKYSDVFITGKSKDITITSDCDKIFTIKTKFNKKKYILETKRK